jgi:hypothetical protein
MSISLTTFADEDDDVDYEDETRTPFLKNDDHDAPISRKPTPLPMRQISVLLSLWLAEAVVENSISPYLNQVRMASNAATAVYELYASRAESNRTAPHSARQRPPDRGRRWTKGGVLHGYHRKSLFFRPLRSQEEKERRIR